MRVVALCPTFRKPKVLANALALWLTQDYPIEKRTLIICDDAQTFPSQSGESWGLVSMPTRFKSLPAKHNYMASLAPPDTDAFLVWDDDDIYLPDYVSRYVAELERHEMAKLSLIQSDYDLLKTGGLIIEPGSGRFHSSIGFRKELLERVGGWPDTDRADFDMQLIGRLAKAARSIGDPHRAELPIPYIYSWHTGQAHCQFVMRSPDDETWYERGLQAYAEVDPVAELVPHFDDRTKRLFALAGRELPLLPELV